MPMYNLLECSSNYSMTSGSLCNYYRDKINDSLIENDREGSKINNDKTIASKSFKYTTKIKGRTLNDIKVQVFLEKILEKKHLCHHHLIFF